MMGGIRRYGEMTAYRFSHLVWGSVSCTYLRSIPEDFCLVTAFAHMGTWWHVRVYVM